MTALGMSSSFLQTPSRICNAFTKNTVSLQIRLNLKVLGHSLAHLRKPCAKDFSLISIWRPKRTVRIHQVQESPSKTQFIFFNHQERYLVKIPNPRSPETIAVMSKIGSDHADAHARLPVNPQPPKFRHPPHPNSFPFISLTPHI